MELLKSKYIIVEVIPTARTKDKGDIVQLSAIKVDGLKIIERFDYRLNEDKIMIPDFLEMTSYDKSDFKYVESTEKILKEFDKWCENIPLLILDNDYTRNFLEDINNKKESILKYLDEEYRDNIIDKLMQKYDISPSNYIVDILYECLVRVL